MKLLIAIDCSASMTSENWTAERLAAALEQGMNLDKADTTVVTFDSQVTEKYKYEGKIHPLVFQRNSDTSCVDEELKNGYDMSICITDEWDPELMSKCALVLSTVGSYCKGTHPWTVRSLTDVVGKPSSFDPAPVKEARLQASREKCKIRNKMLFVIIAIFTPPYLLANLQGWHHQVAWSMFCMINLLGMIVAVGTSTDDDSLPSKKRFVINFLIATIVGALFLFIGN